MFFSDIKIIFHSWETHEKKLFENVSSFFNVVIKEQVGFILMPKVRNWKEQVESENYDKVKILWLVFHLVLSFLPKILNF